MTLRLSYKYNSLDKTLIFNDIYYEAKFDIKITNATTPRDDRNWYVLLDNFILSRSIFSKIFISPLAHILNIKLNENVKKININFI
jgi:hypothetical protein